MGDDFGGLALGDIATALALVLVIEGIAYALFPSAVRRGAASVAGTPEAALRLGGLLVAALGVVGVWLARG